MKLKSLLISGLLAGITITVQADQPAPPDFEAQVDSRLARYAQNYPDIYFMRLEGEPTLPLFQNIRNAMGIQPKNLDYEHDADTIEVLMQAQWGRLATMMQTQSASATLYRLGEQSSFKEPYLCVITLDTSHYQSDPYAATRLMLDIANDSPVTKSAMDNYLDNGHFLDFTVDHEVFHCLDVYRNGALYTKNTSDEEQFQQMLRAEARADMFAALRVLMDNNLDYLVPRIAEVRALSASEGDCTHHTSPMLHVAMSLDMNSVSRYAQARQIDLITNLVEDFIPDVSRYARLTEVDCII